jgi:membrane protein
MKIATADLWSVLRSAVAGFFDDGALSHAAAMAFYAATSLSPILLIVLAIAGMATGRDAAEFAISAQLTGLLGPQGADLLKATVESASANKGTLASTIAVITLLIGASGVFGEMQSTLNLIWKVQPQKTSLFSLARTRIASLGLVASLGFLLLVSLAASAAISAVGDIVTSRLPLGELMLSTLNTLVSVVLVALLFGAIFKILPDRTLSWRDVRFGAAVTAVLFTIGKSLIGWYLGTSAIASSYGAAGSLIVLLLWVFYSSAIFLFGAEITRAVAVRFQSRAHLMPAEIGDTPSNLPSPTRSPTRSLGVVALIAGIVSLAVLASISRRNQL